MTFVFFTDLTLPVCAVLQARTWFHLIWSGRQRIAAIEKKMLIGALERCRWHRGKTAELLQLNYKTLQRKMKAHGIK